MKELIFSLSLFLSELIIYVCLNIFMNVPQLFIYRFGVLLFALLIMVRHYHLDSTLIWHEFGRLIKVMGYFSLITIGFLMPDFTYCFRLILSCFVTLVLGIFIDRTIRVIFRKYLARNTLIIGTGDNAYRLGCICNNNRFSLTNLVGFVKLHDGIESKVLIKEKKYQVFDLSTIVRVIDDNDIDQIIIAIPNASKELLDEVSKKVLGKAKYIKVVPDLNFTMTFNSKVRDFDGILLISTASGRMRRIDILLKRFIDILAGIAGCMLLIPLTIYVRYKNRKNGDTDPIFFTQERIGLNGKMIKIYKYRSMIPNAEAILDELMENDPEIREEYLTNKKLIHDPRITEVGHFLRRTSLDEFPQFINVLKGEMSLVGPRPYLPREREDMDIYYNSIIRCKPGITGMWQANGRSDVGFIDRCKFDDYYYRNWKLGLDMIIIYKTIKSVLYGKGAL